jgi:hypothetical protein
MELSGEQKQRILEEEQARLAEEEYRKQVHRALRSNIDTGTNGATNPGATNPERRRAILLGVAISIIGVGILVRGRVHIEQTSLGTPINRSAAISPASKASSSDSPPPVTERSMAGDTGNRTNQKSKTVPTVHADQSPRGAERCFDYAPSLVTLVGTMSSKTFPGPPNYESVSKGDRPETVFVLNLKGPICTNGDNSDFEKPAHNGVHQLQLLFTDSGMYDAYRPLLDRSVTASGYLFAAMTGHHHTKVMLQASAIDATPE